MQDGKIGHGTFGLSHALPLSDVASVEVTERQVGGKEAQTLLAFGARPRNQPGSSPKQITDITVRTRKGEEARWIVEQRSAEWVRKRLTPALRQSRIPYYDELPPRVRDGS
jgi:hypothetical protein